MCVCVWAPVILFFSFSFLKKNLDFIFLYVQWFKDGYYFLFTRKISLVISVISIIGNMLHISQTLQNLGKYGMRLGFQQVVYIGFTCIPAP